MYYVDMKTKNVFTTIHNWQEKAIELIKVQDSKSYRKEFTKYTDYLLSLDKQKGHSRSNLISMKSAGRFYLEVIGSKNVEDIRQCQIGDFALIMKVKSNFTQLKDNKEIMQKFLNGTLKREDLNPEGMKVESLINKLEKELCNNPTALLKLKELKGLI